MKNEESEGGSGKPIPILQRTKQFAVRIIRLFTALPKTAEAGVIGRQLLKSGTSVGAHCREGHRGRSRAEFVSKFNGALMELEETLTGWNC
jgi:four helix bundle protein